MRIVPQSFFESEAVTCLMKDGLSAFFHKEVDRPNLDNQRLSSAHAISIVLNGALSIHTDEGLPLKVNPGQMVLLPKGLYMITDVIPIDRPFEAMVIFFEDDTLNWVLKDVPFHEPISEFHEVASFDVDDPIRQFLKGLIASHLSGGLINELVKIKLQEFFLLMKNGQSSSLFIDKCQSLRKKGKRPLSSLMNESFDKPLTVEDFATLSGRSVTTFRRDFTRQFGISPKQWLIKMRLQKAKELLGSGNDKVATVSTLSGYTDLPHFIKSFQREFNISPKQFAMRSRIESTY